MSTLIVIDIDGTVADLSRRLKVAGLGPKRTGKVAFQKWLDTLQPKGSLLKDEPIEPMHELLWALASKSPEQFEMVYVTGRSEEHREETARWLDLHRFPEAALIMRGLEDFRSAAAYKEDAIFEFMGDDPDFSNVVVLDDDYDGDCSEVYTANGWLHLKVCWGSKTDG